MLRLRSNCSVTFVCPKPLDDVISVTPAMRPKFLSRGVATADAITSGLAPGKLALTLIVGYSTWGTGATGRNINAIPPASASAKVSNDVAMGRLMNGVDKLIGLLFLGECVLVDHVADPEGAHPRGNAAECEID